MPPSLDCLLQMDVVLVVLLVSASASTTNAGVLCPSPGVCETWRALVTWFFTQVWQNWQNKLSSAPTLYAAVRTGMKIWIVSIIIPARRLVQLFQFYGHRAKGLFDHRRSGHCLCRDALNTFNVIFNTGTSCRHHLHPPHPFNLPDCIPSHVSGSYDDYDPSFLQRLLVPQHGPFWKLCPVTRPLVSSGRARRTGLASFDAHRLTHVRRLDVFLARPVWHTYNAIDKEPMVHCSCGGCPWSSRWHCWEIVSGDAGTGRNRNRIVFRKTCMDFALWWLRHKNHSDGCGVVTETKKLVYTSAKPR